MTDEWFLRNVREARDNGFALVCAECGCGMEDADFEDADAHEYNCSNRGRDRAAEMAGMIASRLGTTPPMEQAVSASERIYDVLP